MNEQISTQPQERGTRKERVGFVVSNKMAKTIVVRVDRRVRHAQYEKVLTLGSKFYAHDEKNEAKIGDRVRITETRPLSRLKRWRLVEVLQRGAEKASSGNESEVAAKSEENQPEVPAAAAPSAKKARKGKAKAESAGES
jgi:small subunit ribosomal protein S17